MRALFAIIGMVCSMAGHTQTTFNVYFDLDKYFLTKETTTQLDSFLAIKKENPPGYIINLDGYCDNRGSDNYNAILSRKRVTAIKNYFLQKGIKPVEISNVTGHGEKDPVNENKTEEERQLNRRVAISIAESGQPSLPIPGETKSLTEKITDTATKAGTSIVLKNMNFYGGSPFLLPESFPIVDELLAVMRRHPALIIEIQGHICCIATSGDSQYGGTGNGLSEERARMIYAELVGKGIEANRVSYKGFGHSVPIYPYPEKTEEERIANRRVEIKIISK